MKLQSFLMLAPVALMLTAPAAPAKDDPKSEKKAATGEEKQHKRAERDVAKQQKQSEKEWPHKTEGHRPQDRNGDGVISRQEWPGNDVSFRELDLDHDGVLTERDRQLQREGSRGRVHDRDGR